MKWKNVYTINIAFDLVWRGFLLKVYFLFNNLNWLFPIRLGSFGTNNLTKFFEGKFFIPKFKSVDF